ncbi:MAG TPA: ankyrin repeat domain-containing protein [Burkholderiales bacterium]|nr:ankyrin repeat domain-containing protein [Burkholderiales bacterium]
MSGAKETKPEKLDFLTKLRIRDLILAGLVIVAAVLVNLPQEYVEETLGFSHNTLLAVLGLSVTFGLFLYLKFFFFLAVVVLIAGANMPEQIALGINEATGLSISKIPIVLALVVMVGIALINHVVKMLPTGLEPKPRERSPEGVRALFYAIEKNNAVYAQKVLSMNFDPNLHHENGYTALAYAAAKGSTPLVEVLLRNGADPTLVTREGDTPVELALRFGHAEVADVLKRARQSRDAGPAGEPALQAG